MIEAVIDGCPVRIASPRTAKQVLDMLGLKSYDEETKIHTFVNKVLGKAPEGLTAGNVTIIHKDGTTEPITQEMIFPSTEVPGYGKKRSKETTWIHIHMDEIALEEPGDEVFISRRIER